jgi:DNA-binding transcriptional ArsR family regulator
VVLTRTQAMLRALAGPRRIAILEVLRERELPAGEIARRFRTTRPAISQHLRVLASAGLLAERRAGVRRLYRIRPEAFEQLRTFLDTFWDQRLARLKLEVEADAGVRRGR